MNKRYRRANGLASIGDGIRRGWKDLRGRSHVSVRARWGCRLLGAVGVVVLAVFTDLPALSVVFLGLLLSAAALWVVDFWRESASTDRC